MLRLLVRDGYYFDRHGVALCSKCKENPAEDPHKCPYAEDIHGNSEPDYCDCCVDCENICRGEI